MLASADLARLPNTLRRLSTQLLKQPTGRHRRIISLVNLCVGNDPNGIRAAASAGAGFYAALPSYRAMLDREGIDDPTDLILAGSMSEIADGLASYVAAGATDLRLGIYAPDQEHARATRDALAEWVA